MPVRPSLPSRTTGTSGPGTRPGWKIAGRSPCGTGQDGSTVRPKGRSSCRTAEQTGLFQSAGRRRFDSAVPGSSKGYAPTWTSATSREVGPSETGGGPGSTPGTSNMKYAAVVQLACEAVFKTATLLSFHDGLCGFESRPPLHRID